MATPHSHPDDKDYENSKADEEMWCAQDFHCPGCVYEFTSNYPIPDRADHCCRCKQKFEEP